MKKIFTLMLLLGAVLLMANNRNLVYACSEYPVGAPLPPNIVCPIMDDESYVDVSADPGEDQYIISSSSVVETVDGYVLYFNNQSNYSCVLSNAIGLWGELDIVSFVDTGTDYNLLITESNNGANGNIALYVLQDGVDTITINTYYFNSLSTLEQTRVLMHELGHALGLDDVYGTSSSIMAQGVSEVLLINSQDIALIEQLYPTNE